MNDDGAIRIGLWIEFADQCLMWGADHLQIPTSYRRTFLSM